MNRGGRTGEGQGAFGAAGIEAAHPAGERADQGQAGPTAPGGPPDARPGHEPFLPSRFPRTIDPMVFSSPVRPWLLPNAVLLAVLVTWGALRYPRLPGRIPEHIGAGGVDAWTDKSIGSAFVLVFLYAGVTVLMTGCAELALRVTPRDELPTAGTAPSAVTPSASSLLNRPASRASARRTARALLLFNTCIGLSFLAGCGILWRSTPDPDVPTWLLAAMALPLLVGTAVTVAAAVGDRKR